MKSAAEELLKLQKEQERDKQEEARLGGSLEQIILQLKEIGCSLEEVPEKLKELKKREEELRRLLRPALAELEKTYGKKIELS